MHSKDNFSVIALDKFIQATRDSGYKGTRSALSELIDNSIQAKATKIEIQILRMENALSPLLMTILDNGLGMDKILLRESLRFGGTSRFDDRSSLGRYGMGLPNSSVSQARRVEVTSWQNKEKYFRTYLDLDEIAEGNMQSIPVAMEGEFPKECIDPKTDSGTLVVWKECDRLDYKRIATLEKSLKLFLGRVFRYFLWQGITITINGENIKPFDPLYVHPNSVVKEGKQFGESLDYEVEVEDGSATGKVSVRFSELPVEKWSELSNKQKREFGVTKGAGVSIVRSNREID